MDHNFSGEFDGLERLREKPKSKKEKDTSNETSPSDILSELEEMVADLTKTPESSDTQSVEVSPTKLTDSTTALSKKPDTVIPTTLPVQQVPPIEHPKKKFDDAVKEILPQWIQKAWRWITPDDAELLEEWLREWGDFLLSFSEVLKVHFIKPRELLVQMPFKNPLVKKQLSLEQIHAVGDDLERRELAKWWDNRKNRLRIYWLPLDEIVDSVYDWAFDGGRDVCTIFDLRNAGEIWSTIPPQELKQLLEMLVKLKKANWADKDQEAVEFIY